MKVLTNYRYYVLFVVFAVGMLGTFAVPDDNLPGCAWTWILFSTKAVGFAAFYLFGRLVNRWEKRGTIPELTKFTEDF